MTPELLQKYLDVIGGWIVSGIFLAVILIFLLGLMGFFDRD